MIPIIALMCLQVPALAQFTPSVYVGSGLFTNLGGVIGIGTEVQYKIFSANVATGASYFDRDNANYIGYSHFLGYDVGMKCYFYKGLFCGVNYGLLYKTRNGFTFSLGYRQTISKRFYCMTYIGITSDKAGNRFFNLVVPRCGFIIGYNFISNEKP